MRRILAALCLSLAPGIAAAACPSVADVARFARALIDHTTPTPFLDMTEAEARCAQRKLVATLAQPWGDVVGFALATEDDPPLRGALYFANLRARSGAEIPVGYAVRPAVAPGLLLRMGEGGRVAAASPYLALLDLAFMPAPGRTARIAGNLGLRLGVVGQEAGVTNQAAMGADAVLQADGSVLASLPALGLASPPEALLAGLARELEMAGQGLRPDEHVALLAAPAPLTPRAGETWQLSVAGLGVVTVIFR